MLCKIKKLNSHTECKPSYHINIYQGNYLIVRWNTIIKTMFPTVKCELTLRGESLQLRPDHPQVILVHGYYLLSIHQDHLTPVVAAG